MECVAIVKPAGVLIQVMWQLGKDRSHVPACLEYHMGGRSEIKRNPEGQPRGYDMTSLQAVPCHITGMRALSYVSNSPIDWQDMWVKDFIRIALACKCASNYM